uniref:Fe2OG dioxygenase domain-containing protein n=1 Tax=Rhizochromulina marina TaxID=1034831 RepID=A0A7S2SR24_9STRA|mmetsp:Transcript_4748/g.14062  ORF Transcript_4748/g.14062 Transcript_4748/m.14062 type:complete len:384 (+) Transcript_4748:136-1287(+)
MAVLSRRGAVSLVGVLLFLQPQGLPALLGPTLGLRRRAGAWWRLAVDSDDRAAELARSLGLEVVGGEEGRNSGLTFAAAPALPTDTVLAFEREGHIATRGLLSTQEMASLRGPVEEAFRRREFEAWFHSARVMLGDENLVDDFGLPLLETTEECIEALEAHGCELPFLQVFNSWREDPAVAEFVCGPRLAAVAAQLLGVSRVRLYQDSMFLKRPGDGATRWHSDLHMAPFDTNDLVTCWIPLDPVPAQEDGGTGLTFASGSHRDFALAFWSRPHETGKDFSARYDDCLASHGALDPGDATWHHGWVLHSSPPNDSPDRRLALTVSFVADGARLRDEAHHEVDIDDEDRTSYEDWVSEVPPGAPVEHAMVPLVGGGRMQGEGAL